MTDRFSSARPEREVAGASLSLAGELQHRNLRSDNAPVADHQVAVPGPDSDAAPSTIFVPQHYEPKYAYPLLIWLRPSEAATGEAWELPRLMSTISDRNYIGIAVDVPSVPAPDNLSVDREALLLDLAARVEQAVVRARRLVHIHTERVFLAGFGTGATWALELGLARPEWFAGMISLAGQFPPSRQALRRFRDLRGKRVLLGTGRRDERATVDEIHSAGRLLHSAGLRVCTRLYDARHEIIREMLNDVDRWVMQEIYEPGVAA